MGLLLVMTLVIEAQTSLSGRVISAKDQTALSGVDVYHEGLQVLTQTDGQGYYRFDQVQPGLQTVTVFALDYVTQTDTVDIGRSQILDFAIQPLTVALTDVEIIAKREELFAIKRLADVVGTSIFAGKKSEVVILDLVQGNQALNNGRQVYAQVAGLNIYEGNAGGLQLNLGGRGLDPNRTSNFNTRQNGYDISADVLGYPESYYTPPTEAVSEIRILRGASSLQYGTQFGGLIDFQLRRIPQYKKIEIVSNQTLSSFGGFSTFNSIGVNKGRWSTNLFYNYKQGDGYRDYSDYKANTLHANLNFAASDKLNFNLEYTRYQYLAQQAGGLTDAQFALDSRQSTRTRNWFDVNWNLFEISASYQVSDATELSWSVFGLDAVRSSVGYRGDPIDPNSNPITTLDEQSSDGRYVSPRDLIVGEFRNVGTELRALTEYSIWQSNGALLVGGKLYKSENKSVQGPGSNDEDADFNLYTEMYPDYANQSSFLFPNFNASLFAESVIYLTDRLSITPGLRFEFIDTATDGIYNQVIYDNAGNAIGNTQFSESMSLSRKFVLGGVGLSYDWTPEVELIANLSQNYRSVTFSDIRVVSPTFIIDPEIRDESGATADVGLRGRVGKLLSYDVTAYSILYNDRIGIILDDRANRVRKNIGRAIIVGTESLISANLAQWLKPESTQYHLRTYLNTALTYSRFLQSEERNVVGKQLEFVPLLNLKYGLSAGYKSLLMSVQYTTLSKQYTDVQNSQSAPIGDSRSGIIGEIPAYQVVDLNMSYTYRAVKLSLGINNLLDKAYFTQRATGYPGPGIIPSDGRSFFITLSYRL